MQRSEVEVSETDSSLQAKASWAVANKRRMRNAALDSPPASIDGRLNLSTKETMRAFGSPRLFQRLRCAKWIVPLFESRDNIYPASQILRAQQRLEDGYQPPLLPSEIKQRAKCALN